MDIPSETVAAELNAWEAKCIRLTEQLMAYSETAAQRDKLLQDNARLVVEAENCRANAREIASENIQLSGQKQRLMKALLEVRRLIYYGKAGLDFERACREVGLIDVVQSVSFLTGNLPEEETTK